jgi:hypothetical protein
MDNTSQSSQPEADPAAAAFAQLVEEVGVVRRLVAANDSTVTLGEIVQRLDTLTEATRVLSRRPAMALTPNMMAEKIAEAAQEARAEDHAVIGRAKDRIEKAARLIEGQTGKIATIRDQRRRITWVGGGGLLAGILLWSFLPGAIARAAPASWHWPERMARHIVGEPTLWQAGIRSMSADSPAAWQSIVQAMQLRRDNREAIDGCRDRATKARHAVSCALMIQNQVNIPARSR